MIVYNLINLLRYSMLAILKHSWTPTMTEMAILE